MWVYVLFIRIVSLCGSMCSGVFFYEAEVWYWSETWLTNLLSSQRRGSIISDTEHAIFECLFPKFFSHAIALFLDSYYNKGRPDFIFLKENFFLFNIYYEQFTDAEYIQLSTLILIAKDRSLKVSKEECLLRWNVYNCFSQSLYCAQFSRKLMASSALQDDFIDLFIQFLLVKKDYLLKTS